MRNKLGESKKQKFELFIQILIEGDERVGQETVYWRRGGLFFSCILCCREKICKITEQNKSLPFFHMALDFYGCFHSKGASLSEISV